MSQYLYMILLPLSKALEEGGRDPEEVWRRLGLEEWAQLPRVRAVLDSHDGLFEDIRQEFQRAFLPVGTINLRDLVRFASESGSRHKLRGEEHDALVGSLPYRRFDLFSPCIVAFDMFFEDRVARRLYRVVDGRPVNQLHTLYDVRVDPGTWESPTLVLASTLREKDLQALRESILTTEGQTIREMQVGGDERVMEWAIDKILAILREAKRNDLDVVTHVG